MSMSAYGLRKTLKVRHRLKGAIAGLDLRVIEGFHPVETEILHVERRHDAPKDDRLTNPLLRSVAGIGQIPHEAAGKGVAGASRIENLFERIGRSSENRCAVEHEHPVLAPLDNQGLHPEVEQLARGLDQVCLPRELACLPLVNNEDVHPLDYLFQRLGLGGYPEIHGVAGD